MSSFSRRACCCALLLFAYTASQAHADASTLAHIQSLLGTSGSVAGRFEQRKHLPELPFPLVSEGEFSFSSQDGLYWATQLPIAAELHLNQKEMVQVQDGKEILKLDLTDNPALSAISQILFAVLSKDWVTLQQYFTLQGEVVDRRWTLKLHPKTDAVASFIQQITLEGSENLTAISLVESSGDSTDITFSNLQNR